MYIIKNAYLNIIRNKGRNLLIGIIMIIIMASTCIALAIKQSGSALIETYKNNNLIEVSFQLNMRNFRKEEGASINLLTIEDIKNYADSAFVLDYYYTKELGLSSEQIEPVSYDEFFNDSQLEDKIEDRPFQDKMDKINKTNFRLTAYSEASYLSMLIEGNAQIIEGKIFENENEIIISSELALANDLEIGNEITFYYDNDPEKTIILTIVGIFEDDSDPLANSFMGMNAMNTRNQIYANIKTIQNIDSETTLGNQLSAKFYLETADQIGLFEKEVREKGLDEAYTIQSNLEQILESLKPIQNISNFSSSFLIIILIVGIVVLGIINMINIRERKYEIGVLRAIGMSKCKVVFELVSEILMVATISLIIGTLIGYITTQPITNQLLSQEINSYQNQSEQLEQNFGGKIPPHENRKNQEENINYVSILTVKIDFLTALKLIGANLLLVITTSTISIMAISKYNPNKILQNRG